MRRYSAEIESAVLLAIGLAVPHVFPAIPWLQGVVCALALLPVGLPVVRETLGEWRRGDFFNEFSLMVLAAAGAFTLGEYPEGVAILLFYSLGEKLEDAATERSRERIRALLSKLPERAQVEGRGLVDPKEVRRGEVIVVRPGERVALDGELLSDEAASFDTSAFTGESLPVELEPGGEVAAGSIPVDRTVRLRVSRPYGESSMSRILAMIDDAASRKSRTETLLRRITRWYTPLVFAAAALLFVVPMVVALRGGGVFEWRVWLERSLVLLVCSCPCALVVSVPLSYFAAIGVASSRGLLFKSSEALDALRRCTTVFFDKTGTITAGKFGVSQVVASEGFDEGFVLKLAAAAEAESSHPLARAILEYAGPRTSEVALADLRTVRHGMEGRLGGRRVLVGSRRLLESKGLNVAESSAEGTEVCVALGERLIGRIYLSDTLRPDVAASFEALRRMGVSTIGLLSGDRREAVESTAKTVGADRFEAGLMPEDKASIVASEEGVGKRTVFVGDGINDAPSLAGATVGVAIGVGGTDLAMETADAVMTTPSPVALAEGFALSRKLKRVVSTNVAFAIGVKLIVMILGALGVATLWAAVFADTGITLLTVIFTLAALRLGKNS